MGRRDERIFDSLRTAVGDLTGVIPSTSLQWAEALWISLEYWMGRLWLIMEPTIWVERTTEDKAFLASRDFIRERLARRYNPKWNELLQAWSDVLTDGNEESELRTFGIGDGVDAVFNISSVNGYSKRGDTV